MTWSDPVLAAASAAAACSANVSRARSQIGPSGSVSSAGSSWEE